MNDLEQWRKELQQYYNQKYFMENPSNWQELANAAVERDYQAEVQRRKKFNILPEVTVTAKGNSKPVNVAVESDLTPSELKALSTPDKARVRYNDYFGRKYAKDAQHAANVVGGILAVPAAGIAAAPVIGSVGAYALNGLEAFRVAHPFMAATIDAGLAADGIRNLATDNGVTKTIRLAKEGKKGRAVLSGLGDVADATGMFDVVRLGKKIATPLYRAGHAYVNISPAGYDHPIERGKKYLEDLLSGKQADISKPKWEGQQLPEQTTGYVEQSIGNPEQRVIVSKMGRVDAWRKYLGLPEKYKVYIQNPDGTFSYNMKMIDAITEGKFSPLLDHADGELNTLGRISSSHGPDFVTGAGGNLTGNTTRLISIDPDGTKHGIQTIEDTWDLHPFSRKSDRLLEKLYDKHVARPKTKLGYFFKELGNAMSIDSKAYNRAYNEYIDQMRRKYGEKKLQEFLGYGVAGIPDPDYFQRRGPIGKIGRWFSEKGDKIIPEVNYEVPQVLKNLDQKIGSFEVGPILGGKPFTMKTEIPVKVIQRNPAKEPISHIDKVKYDIRKQQGVFNGSLEEYLNQLPIREEVRLDYKTGGRLNYLKFFK